MRDHGGDLDRAMARHGGDAGAWIDLSTGINPRAYPLPPIPAEAWTALPRRSEAAALRAVAARAYGAQVSPVLTAGAQGAIQAIPHLRAPGRAAVLGPTYNEHAAALAAAGWQVDAAPDLGALEGADLAVVVNPNNPDGRRTSPEALLALRDRVGLLVVDESFGEVTPALSVAGAVTGAQTGLIVLRSFGKFYGLAGARAGFAICGDADAARLADLSGPWPVAGPAIAAARAALADGAWRAETLARLATDAARLDALAAGAGWLAVGPTDGPALFRTYQTPDAAAAQAHLAAARIWTRIFPYSRGWIRLGLPDGAEAWARVAAALAA